MSAPRPCFNSDNNSGLSPEVLEGLIACARAPGFFAAYGADPWTARAQAAIRNALGVDAQPQFVLTGTGANVLGLATLCGPGELVFVSDESHLYWDEAGAPERLIGARLIALPSVGGKIHPEQLDAWMGNRGVVHRAQPAAVSLTQSSECGTVYSLAELAAWGEYCERNDLWLHLDGARLANAVASLRVGAGQMLSAARADLVSLGGTKNGMFCAEAVLFLGAARTFEPRFGAIRKSGAQLSSKLRFVSAQFEAAFTDERWLVTARRANELARTLGDQIAALSDVRIVYPVQANAVFVSLPEAVCRKLEHEFEFYRWDLGPAAREPGRVLVRLMTAFDTPPEWITQFVVALRSAVG